LCPKNVFGMRFSTTVFSVEAVKRAAYRLSGEASFEIQVDGSDIVVTAETLKGRPEFDEARFKTEVLDADLRLKIAEETEDFRNAILSHVFSRSGLIDRG
jgi:His-Xaa-Ser system protein HxsD